MIVYSNSCSFGGAPLVNPGYPEIVSQKLDAVLINKGLPGACNRRIFRTSIRDLLVLKQQHPYEKILCLVGLTFISRTEMWQENLSATENDGHFHSIKVDHKKIDWSNGLINTRIPDIYEYADAPVKNYYKEWLMLMSKEALVLELTTDMIAFSGFCYQNQIPVLVWQNAEKLPMPPEVDINDVFLRDFYLKICGSPEFINPWEFSFCSYALEKGYQPIDEDLYGINGHPGTDAHRDMGNFIIEQLNQRKIL